MFSETSAAPIFLGFERGNLLVQGADFGTLGIVEYRAVDGAGDMVFGKFGGGADVDDFIVAGRKVGDGRAVLFHRSILTRAARLAQT